MNQALLSSKNNNWCTPKKFFDELDSEFHFVLDAAANENSAKRKDFFTPEQDGLLQSWKRAEIRFLRGRLKFTDEAGNSFDPAPFPSMVAIYNV